MAEEMTVAKTVNRQTRRGREARAEKLFKKALNEAETVAFGLKQIVNGLPFMQRLGIAYVIVLGEWE